MAASCSTASMPDRDWARYARRRRHGHESVMLRDRLFARYLPLVPGAARRMGRRLPPNITVDDLCSAGYLGLLEAIECYSPDRRVSFETFSAKRIRGAMIDWVRTQSRLLRNDLQFRRAVSRLRSQQGGEYLPDGEMARRLGIELERFHTLERRARARTEVLFCSLEYDDPTGRRTLPDWPDPRQPDPSAGMERQWLLERIRREVDLVGWTILKRYYFEHQTLRQIGRALNLCEARVSQIHSAIIKRLRKRFPSENLM